MSLEFDLNRSYFLYEFNFFYYFLHVTEKNLYTDAHELFYGKRFDYNLQSFVFLHNNVFSPFKSSNCIRKVHAFSLCRCHTAAGGCCQTSLFQPCRMDFGSSTGSWLEPFHIFWLSRIN